MNKKTEGQEEDSLFEQTTKYAIQLQKWRKKHSLKTLNEDRKNNTSNSYCN